MEQKHNSITAKYFFLSLGTLVSLIASVSAFLTLAFQVLNQRFPDALNATYTYGYNTYNFEGIRTSLATLIIVFPIFLALSYFWSKASRGELSAGDGIIRKWMIYLVLFLAGIVIAADLVTLVKYFVSGEITTRFIWKVIAVAFAAKLVGVHYFYELGIHYFLKKHARFFHALIAGLAVLGLIVWSFTVIGSPKKQRDLRFDQRRVDDLQSIQYQVINYWQQKEKIPQTLADLSDPISSYMVPVDPEVERGKMYEYRPTGNLSFELCATFSLPMPKGYVDYSGGVRPLMGSGGRDIAVSSYPGGKADSWDHESGRTCFTRTIDPDIYQPFPKTR